MIVKILMLLFSFSALTWAQDPIGNKQWSDAAYKQHPFSFPETLSKADINEILLSIKALTSHEVFVIRYQSKDRVAVNTCTHGIREPFLCNGGEIFVYKKIKNNWHEIPKQRSLWIQ